MTARLDRSLIPLKPDLKLESSLWNSGIRFIAGIDEAGRGAWAGPVAAAAVVFHQNAGNLELLKAVRDSKQLSARQRYQLEPIIKEQAEAYAVGLASSREIDELGILPATRLAMTRAIQGLNIRQEHLLIDALFLPEIPTPQTALIKGDQRSLSIAAASILAKTARDCWMEHLADNHPGYAFERNRGYGTRAHQAALLQLGTCPHHRFSFAPIKGFQK